MKQSLFYCLLLAIVNNSAAQIPETIVLNKPDMERQTTLMQALLLRASATEFDTTDISLQDLSDLLWAANGINRQDENKRTAPSAINAQDIDIYVVMKNGSFFYNPQIHVLELVAAGDHRKIVAGKQQAFANAPVFCLLVSDISRFSRGEQSQKLTWAAFDAGIVSQNISLFCASAGLETRVRASMDSEELKKILKLNDSQHIMLNNPVSYK